jgi:hypothetical protein
MSEQAGKSIDPALEAEFDMVTAKAGMPVPADRKAGVLAAYVEQKRLSELLRKARSPFEEPANVYNINEVLRSR